MKIRKYPHAFQRSFAMSCLTDMQTNTPLYLLGIVLFALSCESNAPPPMVRLRAERMSYDHSYRVLEYDNSNRAVRIIVGLLDDEDEANESVYTVSYNGWLVHKIALDTRWVMEYKYNGTRVIETHEIVEGELNSVNRFFYDGDGWMNERQLLIMDEGPLRESIKYTYEYDDGGNFTRVKEFLYNQYTDSYEDGPVMEFENYDNTPNAYGLFMTNFANVYSFSPNNARLWRVRQPNGTVGEVTYTFQYNEEGYLVKQKPLSGGHEITYTFERF